MKLCDVVNIRFIGPHRCINYLFFSLSTGSSTDSDQVLFPLLCGQVLLAFQTLQENKLVNKTAVENKSHTIHSVLSM